MTIRTKLTPLGAGNPPYKRGFVLFESWTPGTYTIPIKSGTYEITITGGGGGAGGSAGSHAWIGGNGGSAAAFKARIKLKKGTLTIVIGAGGSGGGVSGRNAPPGNNGNPSTLTYNSILFVTAGAGNGGGGSGDCAYWNNGNGGVLTLGALIGLVTTIIQSDGVRSSTESLLGNGFGAGGLARYYNSGLPGANGYIKIVFVK